MEARGTGVDSPAFALLGPVGAMLGARPVPLGPPQRRAVLVPLLLGAGRVCSSDQLIDAVWGPTPPDKAPAALQAHVSVLRRVLEPEREPRKPSRVIQSIGRGYVLGVQEFSADVFVFRHRVAQAAKARLQGRVDGAAQTLRSALELWRGPALLDVPGPFAQLHRERLTEERLAAVEELIDLELTVASGPVDHDLGELLSTHPHRERLHALNMRLLHHNGRRADALAAYAVARRRLTEDLGLDPGPELQALHRSILADDQPVRPPARITTTSGRVPSAPRLIGRDKELRVLTDLLGDQETCPHVVVLHGIPGSGKTALAVRAASSFPGGKYLLTRSSSAAECGEVMARIAAGERSLLILDGLTDASQADLPVPADGRCTVLVTSENRMRDLPFVTRIELAPLAPSASMALLGTVIGAERAAIAPSAVDWLVQRCGGLPKVLLTTAHHLASRPDWDLDEYVENIVAMHEVGDFEMVNTRVRPFFEPAYAELSEQAATVLRTAALHPLGTFSPHAVAAMLRRSASDVDMVLDELVDHNLLDGVAPGRYRFHALVRQFALARGHALDPAAQRIEARRRLAEYFMTRLRAVVSGRGGLVVSGRGGPVVSGRGGPVVSGRRGNGIASGRGIAVASGRGSAVVSSRGSAVVSGRGGGGREFTREWVTAQREVFERLLGQLPSDTRLVRDACALLAWLRDERRPAVVA